MNSYITKLIDEIKNNYKSEIDNYIIDMNLSNYNDRINDIKYYDTELKKLDSITENTFICKLPIQIQHDIFVKTFNHFYSEREPGQNIYDITELTQDLMCCRLWNLDGIL